MMTKEYEKMAPFELSDVYDEKKDRINVPAGSGRFGAIAYKNRYPVIFAKVAGTTQPIHKKAIQKAAALIRSQPDIGSILLIPEPHNRYDSNAILVGFVTKNSRETYPLGYIPAPLAKLLTQIKKAYNMKYTARIDDLRSNLDRKTNKELSFPCSVKLILSPEIEEDAATAPRFKTLSIGTSGMTLSQLQKKLSKKHI